VPGGRWEKATGSSGGRAETLGRDVAVTTGRCIEAPWAIVFCDGVAPHAMSIAHADKSMAILEHATRARIRPRVTRPPTVAKPA
jgi:hypothetical protein